MKKTLLNSALANMTGALALTIMFGTGVAFADDNNASQGHGNVALQDFLNGSINGNLSGNTVDSNNDNDGVDVDVAESLNGNLNGNLSNNTVHSNNDNDGLDLDANVSDSFNKEAWVNVDKSENWQQDNSITLDNIALLISDQYLFGYAASVQMQTGSGDITTGSIMYGNDTNKMFAGNLTVSNNSGVGSVAQAASAVQANGTINIH